ncbi:hypothetical protein C1646_771928 [Rhizophagus diaphanus]|nr:hypothetical protein C1646_771928 [Rhizophagus diaphanus] [Rhizophagus sp. MUCL 43196]
MYSATNTYSTDCVTSKTTIKAISDLPASVQLWEDFFERPTNTSSIPDFNCHLVGSLILVMEVKKKHILEDISEQIFPKFYNTSKAKENPKSPKPQVLVLAYSDNNLCNLQSHSKSTSSSSIDQQSTSSTFANQQSSFNILVN